MDKKSGFLSDYAATVPASVASSIPIVGPAVGIANFGGSLAGLAVDPAEKKNRKTDALSFVPGVGNYRLSQRLRRVADVSTAAGKSGSGNLVSEVIGPVTGSILPTAVGGYLGYKAGPRLAAAISARLGEGVDSRATSAVSGLAGASLGMALPSVIAKLTAAITRKRSKQEQIDADTTGRAVSKLVVPGLAEYDSWKRLGASSHYDDADGKQKKGKQRKAAEVKSAGLESLRGILRSAKIFGAGAATGGIGLGAPGYNKGYHKGFDEVAPLVGKPATDWTVSDVKLKDKVLKRLAELKLTQKKAGFLDTAVGSGKFPYDPGVLSNLLANEHLRRAALGAGVAGTTAAVTSKKNRFRNALLAALGGGAATYGASYTGALDNLLSPIVRDLNEPLRRHIRDQTAREITRTLRGPDTGSFVEKVRRFQESAPHAGFNLGAQR